MSIAEGTAQPLSALHTSAFKSPLWKDLLVVLPFIVFYLFQLTHHQMWRDELNAWGLAAASPNLKVLYQYIRYEGHPGLWYFLLWMPSRFTASPVAMKCLQAVIGIAIYLFIALRAPLSRWEKLLLYFSYFISFEYTVISRMYGVGLLLSLIYADRRARKPELIVSNSLLLALMANTEVTFLILSGSLLIEYALAIFVVRTVRPDHKRIWRASIVYALGLFAAAAALNISPHISWRTTGHVFQYATSLKHLVQAIVSNISVPWFPITVDFPHHFWNPLLPHPFAHPFLIAVCPVIAVAMLMIFRENWTLLTMLGITTIGAILLAHLVYMGSSRHYGITFTAFLVAFWVMRYSRPTSWVAVVLLILSAVGGVQAAIAQHDHPFSQGSAAATWLKANGLDHAPLVGTPDTSTIGVAEQLERPIYMLDCNCSNTFLLFSNQRDDFDPVQIPDRISTAARKLHASDLIFITSYPVPPERVEAIRAQGFSIRLAAEFTGAEDGEENFYIYRLAKK